MNGASRQIILFLLFSLFSQVILSSTAGQRTRFNYDTLRRLVVFPVHGASDVADSMRETVWWEVRQQLSEDGRFLVATKRFLERQNVYFPRNSMEPAEAIMLGKLLEADGLASLFVREGEVHLRVYETYQGVVLWQQSMEMVLNATASSQLSNISRELIKNFLAHLPYQGYQTADPLQGTATFQRQGEDFARVKLSLLVRPEVGEQVQWIELFGQYDRPLYLAEKAVRVTAQGEVTEVLNNKEITVKIVRRMKKASLKEGSMIRLPEHYMKLRKMRPMSQDHIDDPLYLARSEWEKRGVVEDQQGKRQLATALTFLANLAIFLVLAF